MRFANRLARGGISAGLLLLAGCGWTPATHPGASPAPTQRASHAPRPSPSSPTSGNTIVTEALAVVAQSANMPLRGPEGIPGHPLTAKTWLTAETTATSSHYAVALVWAPAAFFGGPAPPSTVVARGGPLTPDGSFGGRQFATATAARAALATTNASVETGGTGVPAAHPVGVSQQVTVLSGVTARAWHLTEPGQAVLLWRQRGWHWELTGTATVAEARRLASWVASRRLPAPQGLFTEAVARTGMTVVLDWTQGRAVYWTRGAGPAPALTMADAMVAYGQVSATLLGPAGRILPPDRAIAQQETGNRISPWVDLTSPQQNQGVRPGQVIEITGHVLTHSQFIDFADVQMRGIGVSLLAGDTKPSLQIAAVERGITVSASGAFAGALRIPYELPALYGPLLTLVLQYTSHMAPVTQILLSPQLLHRPAG